MSKSRSVPSGVRTFGHKTMSDKGSKHPSDIGPGMQGVDKMGGGQSGGGDKDFVSAAKTSVPGGVVRGDGTETRRGTKVVHKAGGKVKQPKGSGTSYPGEVKQHSGLKAPRSVK